MNERPDAGFPHRQIDWHAFLNRPRLPSPSQKTLQQLREKSILITGAGGSIGSSLSLQLAHLHPKKLVLLDSSEQALYSLQSKLKNIGLCKDTHIVLGSVTDALLLDETFAIHSPQIVFHAAAHKHVPLLESHPLAAIANNILGTNTLVLLARKHGAERVILLSTDKAADPASILGATKRIAEQITLAYKGVVLRLGNVLESDGSVVELFLQQIASDGPVTVTDRNASRYFLTRDEAVDLLLTCSIEAGSASIFVPQLDRSHNILSLAEFLITTQAMNRSISITFTCPRPGDKAHEILWTASECPLQNSTSIPLPGVLQLAPSTPGTARLVHALDQMQQAVKERDLSRAMEVIQQLVPTYVPSDTIRSLAQQSNLKAISQ
ncbi:polysaccharide biosynthesis protein [Acidicapsa ligni]|uniref:polysaccharide biosynthesis protein n=1 Tax=Acidicapsa ligni TaxID=542300 RepID=UPI0021E02896|nr:polysaccharide biosynthesis protein [Acidicapsa ligni]